MNVNVVVVVFSSSSSLCWRVCAFKRGSTLFHMSVLANHRINVDGFDRACAVAMQNSPLLSFLFRR